MQVILRPSTKQKMVKVEKDHYWYDQETKKMLHGRGGELQFRYDPKLRKSVPHLVDVDAPIRSNNFADIENWVQNTQFDVSVLDVAPNHYILIDVASSSLTEVEADLYRNGIVYDD